LKNLENHKKNGENIMPVQQWPERQYILSPSWIASIMICTVQVWSMF